MSNFSKDRRVTPFSVTSLPSISPSTPVPMGVIRARSIYARAAALLFMLLCLQVPAAQAREQEAIFAGGCFWCMEALYQEIEGVSAVVSGFSGGLLRNPTYNGNHAGHYEVVRVTYDPTVISYQQLLDLYWVNIDPFDNRGQFCDKGPSYRSAIFAGSPAERALAEKSKQVVMQRFAGQLVVTEILDTMAFYPVEASHQDYYKKNPLRYKFYRASCRRDGRLETIWGDDAKH
ncbi:MAG: peptide-methionine (S)-S-oxide reductase [Candidatus Paceibacteria bacterium]|jgi:peptide-methionine (S)-S-oxide reductase